MAIVTHRPYRLTRNPIYLGMFLGQTGLAVGFAITAAAFNAVSARLPLGTVSFEREPDERLIWLAPEVVNRLRAQAKAAAMSTFSWSSLRPRASSNRHAPRRIADPVRHPRANAYDRLQAVRPVRTPQRQACSSARDGRLRMESDGLNARTTPETVEALYAIADRQGLAGRGDAEARDARRAAARASKRIGRVISSRDDRGFSGGPDEAGQPSGPTGGS
jgi:hypothetical protein